MIPRFLRRWFSRDSLENPSTTLAEADDWLYDAWGGERSAAGVRVGRKKALGYSAFWCAVNLISRDIAKLPLVVYRAVGEGRERASDHPAYALLHRRPAPNVTPFTLLQHGIGHVLLRGNAYIYIVRDQAARPLELLLLDPEDTLPVRVNGRTWYRATIRWPDGSTEQRKLPTDDVLHFKGLGYDGLVGYDVLTYAKHTLGPAIAARDYGARFFANHAEPRVVVELPAGQTMNAEAQKEFLRQWNQMHQGLENAHRTAILTNGASVKPLSINARQAQLIDVRALDIREVANLFPGLPPHKIGDTTRTGHASLEEENQSYLDVCLDPWLVSIEQEAALKLLTEEELLRETHRIEFNRLALLRPNATARGNFYHNALLDGWMNRDEVRARENLNPLPDGQGQQFYTPANMQVGAPLTLETAA